MALPAPSSIEVLNNAAVRDSRFTDRNGAPAVNIGQGVFLKDTGELEFWYGPSVGWRPPWNLPWGEFERLDIWSNVSVNSYIRGGPVNGLRLAFAPLQGRRYLLVVNGTVDSNANGDIVALDIMSSSPVIYADGSGADAGSIVEQAFPIAMAGEAGSPARVEVPVTFAEAKVNLYVAAGQIVGTGGHIAANNNQSMSLQVHDIGPAAAPLYR